MIDFLKLWLKIRVVSAFYIIKTKPIIREVLSFIKCCNDYTYMKYILTGKMKNNIHHTVRTAPKLNLKNPR